MSMNRPKEEYSFCKDRYMVLRARSPGPLDSVLEIHLAVEIGIFLGS